MSSPSFTPPAIIANGPSGCDERGFRVTPDPPPLAKAYVLRTMFVVRQKIQARGRGTQAPTTSTPARALRPTLKGTPTPIPFDRTPVQPRPAFFQWRAVSVYPRHFGKLLLCFDVRKLEKQKRLTLPVRNQNNNQEQVLVLAVEERFVDIKAILARKPFHLDRKGFSVWRTAQHVHARGASESECHIVIPAKQLGSRTTHRSPSGVLNPPLPEAPGNKFWFHFSVQVPSAWMFAICASIFPSFSSSSRRSSLKSFSMAACNRPNSSASSRWACVPKVTMRRLKASTASCNLATCSSSFFTRSSIMWLLMALFISRIVCCQPGNNAQACGWPSLNRSGRSIS